MKLFSSKTKLLISIAALVLMMIIIFVFSSQSGPESNTLSDPIVDRLISLLVKDYAFMPGADAVALRHSFVLLVRKGAHILEYALLGMFSLLAFRTAAVFFSKSYKPVPVYSMILCVLYAVTDEYHQSFTEGRLSSSLDVLIDSVGSLLGIVFLIILFAISAALLNQIIRFLIVGFTVFIIDYILLWIFWDKLGLMYLIASSVSFCISTVVNYLLSMRFVFRGRDNVTKKREFVVFFVLNAIGLCINAACMWIFVSKLNLDVMVAKVFVTAIVMIWSFISRKVFLEKR